MKLDADEIEKVAYWLKNSAIESIEADLNGIKREIPKIRMAWTTQDGRESLELIQNNVDSFLLIHLDTLKSLSDKLLKIAANIRDTQSTIKKDINNYRSGSDKYNSRRDMVQ